MSLFLWFLFLVVIHPFFFRGDGVLFSFGSPLYCLVILLSCFVASINPGVPDWDRIGESVFLLFGSGPYTPPGGLLPLNSFTSHYVLPLQMVIQGSTLPADYGAAWFPFPMSQRFPPSIESFSFLRCWVTFFLHPC